MIRFLRQSIDKRFYLGMTLLICAVAVFGFSRTIDHNLIHPAKPPIPILYVHALIMSSWVLLQIVQSAFVNASNIRMHRRLGVAGVVLGTFLPVVGTATAILDNVGTADYSFMAASFDDMLTFSIAFGLAVYWRRRPEYHRRLMLIATCALMGAPFARFPSSIVPDLYWYVFADMLILLGILRDLIVIKRVHIVYLMGFPAVVAGHALAMYLFLVGPPWWLATVNFILL